MNNIFEDANWSHSNGGSDLIRSFKPNTIWRNKQENAGAIVIERSKGNDFALNAKAYNFSKTALEEGRITAAYVVLVERGTKTVVASMPLSELVLGAPIPGLFNRGDYWWLNENLKDARLADADAPF